MVAAVAGEVAVAIAAGIPRAAPEAAPGAAEIADAPEVNDGRDNQCSGDADHGVIDEISGTAGFTDPSNPNRFCWVPQAGATSYQVARSTAPDFTANCAVATVADTCLVDPFVPPQGQGYFYLVRALTPFAGSWGRNSSGAEIVVPCAP